MLRIQGGACRARLAVGTDSTQGGEPRIIRLVDRVGHQQQAVGSVGGGPCLRVHHPRGRHQRDVALRGHEAAVRGPQRRERHVLERAVRDHEPQPGIGQRRLQRSEDEVVQRAAVLQAPLERDIDQPCERVMKLNRRRADRRRRVQPRPADCR